ncbi:MAG: pyridoxamine 5'-phosphate oxidase family protein [Bacteroidota bacterium]
MSDIIWNEIREELQNGAKDPSHPFHFFTFATIGLERTPRLRTVVLRKVTEELNLIFYTDQRSKKVLHINENNRVSMLFYDQERLLQLKIEGLAKVRSNAGTLKMHWATVPSKNRRDYTKTRAPGSTIAKPEGVEYLKDKNYFCLVEVEPFKIEYLKIQTPDHLRIRFSRADESWKSDFLVP